MCPVLTQHETDQKQVILFEIIPYHRPHTDLLKPWLSVAADAQRFLCAVAPLKLKGQLSNTGCRLKVEKRLQTRGKS